jgi:hypothetical protein
MRTGSRDVPLALNAPRAGDFDDSTVSGHATSAFPGTASSSARSMGITARLLAPSSRIRSSTHTTLGTERPNLTAWREHGRHRHFLLLSRQRHLALKA